MIRKLVNLSKNALQLQKNANLFHNHSVNKINQASCKVLRPTEEAVHTKIKIDTKNMFESITTEEILKQAINLKIADGLCIQDYELILKTFLKYKVFPTLLSIQDLVNVSMPKIYTSIMEDPSGRLVNHLIENPQNWCIFSESLDAIKNIDLNRIQNIDKNVLSVSNSNSQNKQYIFKNLVLNDFEYMLINSLKAFQESEFLLLIDSLSVGEIVSEAACRNLILIKYFIVEI